MPNVATWRRGLTMRIAPVLWACYRHPIPTLKHPFTRAMRTHDETPHRTFTLALHRRLWAVRRTPAVSSAAGDDHWQVLKERLPESYEARAIAIHPHNPQVIYAGTNYGPYRSIDGGDHRELGFPDPGMVVFHPVSPQNPQIMYSAAPRCIAVTTVLNRRRLPRSKSKWASSPSHDG